MRGRRASILAVLAVCLTVGAAGVVPGSAAARSADRDHQGSRPGDHRRDRDHGGGGHGDPGHHDPACQITNDGTHAMFTTLQAAQDAATTGDSLSVTGTCVGTTLISKSLTITGRSAGGFLTPTLQGDGDPIRAVLAIEEFQGLVVTIHDLVITGGATTGGGLGGGILNGGTLTLDHTIVTGNTSGSDGGGILNTLSLDLDDSAVTGNTAVGNGGGIENHFMLTLDRSIVNGNKAVNGGGVDNFSGTVTSTKSLVAGNTATSGGGIFNDGSLTLDNSAVVHNTASNPGGGVDNFPCGVGWHFTETGTNLVAGNAPDDIANDVSCGP